MTGKKPGMETMAKEHEKIYHDLKQRIIWLDLAPESVVNVSETAESIGVSRTPVKEALILLQAEGWVLRQGSHFMVTPLSLDRIREITDIRVVLEVQANVWAARRMTEESLDRLRELARKALAIPPGTANREMVELDFKIHHTIFKATRNLQLAQLLERLLYHYLRLWLSIPREIDKESLFGYLPELIEALENKNETKLRKICYEHISGSVEEIMLSFLKYPRPEEVYGPGMEPELGV